jgi:hypothetical protein
MAMTWTTQLKTSQPLDLAAQHVNRTRRTRRPALALDFKKRPATSHMQHSRARIHTARAARQTSHSDTIMVPSDFLLKISRRLGSRQRSVWQTSRSCVSIPYSPIARQIGIDSVTDFLDYYYDLLSYVHTRQTRLNTFKAQNPPPPATPDAEYNDALNNYLGRERANLRKRRTRLRQGDFQILTQVGQGGYGQVFLAQKKDTREVCALKVMSKKLLFKLDEVRHVLTERDILTSAKSEWLVRLLYSFQDEKSIYLAMVSPMTLVLSPERY